MRFALLPLLILPMAMVGWAAVQPGGSALQAARAEWAAAERESRRLGSAAGKAEDEASRLALERQAAAAAILAAEARISAAATDLRLRRAAVAAAETRLAERQRPVAGLVAALVNMERRPPLLALADGGSVGELVRTRALLGVVIPHVRAKSAAVTAELARARSLEGAARAGQQALVAARADLDRKRERFAVLERNALARSQRIGQAALEAGDTAIVASVGLGEMQGAAARAAAARRIADRLAALPPAPPRPFAGEDGAAARGLPPYRLPTDALVLEGQGAISDTGIRARGTRLDTRRGSALAMPADGTIAFSGPFRSHDGVVILDHGGAWMTMLLNARAEQPRGTRLKQGEPLGVALGHLTVELSRGGEHVSPALVAARSRSLSIQARRR